VPVIADAVGANVSVRAADSRATSLTFTGKSPLVVAAKAAQLRCEQQSGFWVNQRFVRRGEIRGIGEPDEASYLTDDTSTLVLD
jgi:hypothetical protein